jgi:hypothetical protein
MAILLVKSIFCPNKKYYDQTINSIIDMIDFVNYINKDNIKITCLIIGWTKFKEYNDKIINILDKYKSLFINISFDFFTINYGKYHIFNNIKKYIMHNDISTILYLDHDIQIELSDINIFHTLNNLLRHSVSDNRIGVIALNQKGDNRHQPDIYQHKQHIDNIIILHPDVLSFGSIASGAFYASADCFKIIGNLECLVVYGLDDYYLSKKIYESNYKHVVIKDMYVYHPFNDDKQYTTWKRKQVIQLISDKISYQKTVQESINFWNGF